MDSFEITYALSKQVPAMRHAVRLCSDYGELELHGRSAAEVAGTVERILKAKLERLEKARSTSERAAPQA